MIEKISTLEVRKRLGDILNRVSLRHDEFVIERKGTSLAAIVPVEKLEQLRRFAREHGRELMRRQGPSALTGAEADALANQAKHATRPKRRK